MRNSKNTASWKKKGGHNKAFTLAEVLITLGIIGVVAALTIPSLLSRHRANVAVTKMQKFDSTIAQAFKLVEQENDNVTYWEWPATNDQLLDWYNKYLDKYIVTIKKQNSNENNNFAAETNSLVLYFPDGTATQIHMSAGYMHFSFFINAKEIRKTKLQEGVDWFLFGLNTTTSTQFNTYGSNQTNENTLKNDASTGCYNKTALFGNAFCARLIQANGWKIPDDYPYKF